MGAMLYIIFFSFILVAPSFCDREHKVHNIVLYPDRHSWCQTTPIKQVVALPGYEPMTIDNNVCVGACYSYSIPRTQPAEPGELIGPYCDSCQPIDTRCYHVTLKNEDDTRTVQKRVQIITNCTCLSCNKLQNTDCVISDEHTAELPADLFGMLYGNHNNLSLDMGQHHDDIPELLNLPQNRSEGSPNMTIGLKEQKIQLKYKVIQTLKSIMEEGDLSNDKSQVQYFVSTLENLKHDLSDKNLIQLFNLVNAEQLDLAKIKEVLLNIKQDQDILEKHRIFGLGNSVGADSAKNNANIESDIENLEKIYNIKNFGIEGSRLGLGHYKGSHIGMGIHQTLPDSNAIPESTNEPQHHFVGEVQNVGLDTGHLTKGPHDSLVLSPNVKVEQKLHLEPENVKPNQEGVVIQYENHPRDSQLVTLKNEDDTRTVQKRVQIITNCTCLSCNKLQSTDCVISDEHTAELPAALFGMLYGSHNNLTLDMGQHHDDIPELLNLPQNRSEGSPNMTIGLKEQKIQLKYKVIQTLKSIMEEGDLSNDKSQLQYFVITLENLKHDLSDKNLIQLFNLVNAEKLDLAKVKEVLLNIKQDQDILEKHRIFGLGNSVGVDSAKNNANIESDIEDLEKIYNIKNFGIEGSRLGLGHYKGSHIGMGIHQTLPDSNAIPESTNEPQHHFVGEVQNVGLDTGHLTKGPHDSLVLSPNVKVEQKLHLEPENVKPNQEGVVIQYENHPRDSQLVTLKNEDDTRTVQKRVQIITNCTCLSCNKLQSTDCVISDEHTAELPAALFGMLYGSHNNLTLDMGQHHDDIPELLNLPQNRSEGSPNMTIGLKEQKIQLKYKVIQTLKSIMEEGDLSSDKSQLQYFVITLENLKHDLSDKNLIQLFNLVNAEKLDLAKVKEVLLNIKQDQDILEKHRIFGLGNSVGVDSAKNNANIESDIDDLEKIYNIKNFGIEGSRLGLGHYKGSHIGMGIHQTLPDSNAIPESTNKPQHHFVGEVQNVGLDTGHLTKGPHDSLVLSPNVKVEQKLHLEPENVKPNQEGVVIQYENHPRDSQLVRV